MGFRRRLTLAVLLALAMGYVFARVSAPPLLASTSFSTAIVDKNQTLLRLTLALDGRYRLWSPLDRMAPSMVRATLLKEDRFFFHHFGINPVSLLKAVWHTFISRDRRLGGSTITMQVVRLRDGATSRTIRGKLKQLAGAVWLEARYSKDAILEAYLNLAPYGFNIEGAAAASRIYFHKPVRALETSEAISLAVMPQNPSVLTQMKDLKSGRYPERLSRPRAKLAAAWRKAYPDETKLSELEMPWELGLLSDLPFLAPHFVESVLKRNQPIGEIATTLQFSLQKIVERQVHQWIARRRNEGVTNAAALLVDTQSMETLAWVGSADYFNSEIDGQVDGITSRRSPGSALKPFLYGLALDEGVIHPLSMLKDAPARYGTQNPENFDHEFFGPVSAKDSLNRSRNLPALYLNSLVKKPSLYDFLKSAEVEGLADEAHYGLGLVLGNSEISPAKLAELYAMLANGGKLRWLRLREEDPKMTGKDLLSPAATELILEMLRENPRTAQGFLDKLTRGSQPVAWKTGTSYAFRDAWSAGVSGRYALVTWVGNFDGRGNPAFVGRDAAAPLFFGILDAVRSQGGIPGRPEPTGLPISRIPVCAISGHLPGPHCKHQILTAFIPGKSPIGTCEIHREVYVDRRTGKRTCAFTPPRAEARVYEFWPSDLLRLFRLAGVPRRTPPAADASCGLDEKASRGISPQITSPARELTYHVRGTAPGQSGAGDRIALSAVADADVGLLHWFIEGRYLGKVSPGEPLLWQAIPGRFTVRVVDDQGRAASQLVTVLSEE